MESRRLLVRGLLAGLFMWLVISAMTGLRAAFGREPWGY